MKMVCLSDSFQGSFVKAVEGNKTGFWIFV